MAPYIAILRKQHDGSFVATFPDVSDCVAIGTLAEIRDKAASALRRLLEHASATRADIPRARGIDEIVSNPAYTNGVAFLVYVEDAPSPPTRELRRTAHR